MQYGRKGFALCWLLSDNILDCCRLQVKLFRRPDMVDEAGAVGVRRARQQADHDQHRHPGRHAEHASRNRRNVEPLAGRASAQEGGGQHVVDADGEARHHAASDVGLTGRFRP